MWCGVPCVTELGCSRMGCGVQCATERHRAGALEDVMWR